MNPPKMPLHIGDYKRDTGHLRAAGHGAYLMLLFHYWSTGGLPDDDDQLATIACMTRAEWRKARPTIEKFFKPGWKHGRIDFELDKAAKISEAAREAGKASGRSRSVERQLNDRSSTVEPTLEPLNPKKKDAADAAPAPEDVSYYRRIREVLGDNAGGVGKQLLAAKGGSYPLARAAIEQASTKGKGAREYIGAIIRGSPKPEADRLKQIEQFREQNQTAVVFATDVPGGIPGIG